MKKLHTGAALLLVGLLGTLGCSVGTKDDNADIGVQPQAGTTAATSTNTPAAGQATSAQAGQPNGAVLLIMDASGSMNRRDASGKPYITSAKDALHKVVDGLPQGLNTGLRVFGHGYSGTDKTRGCRDSELIAPVRPLDKGALNTAIDGYAAKGYTPIGYSLQQAASDLPPEGKRTILLVSDGEDTCGVPDPCQVAENLRGNGVDVVIDTVGMALGSNDKARTQLKCIAEAGGGRYYEVGDIGALGDTLSQVSARETRRFEPTGNVLEGAPIPPQANDGQLGTQYTDTVKFHEVNYYHFPVPAGSKIEAAVYLAGNPAAAGRFMCITPSLVDDGDRPYSTGTFKIDDGDQNLVSKVDPATVNLDEVWLKVVSGCATGADDKNLDFDIQFKVDTVG